MLRETKKVLTVRNNRKLILMQKPVTKNTDVVVNPQHVIKTTSEHIISFRNNVQKTANSELT